MKYVQKYLIILLVLFMGNQIALAQSMSDDKIMEYISKESAKGTSQQKIVTELLKKGVTTPQLQRVRRKAESMLKTQKNNGSLVEEPKTNRRRNITNSYDLSGQRLDPDVEEGGTGLSMNQRGLYIDGDQDSLMWYMEHQEEGRRVFGRDIFNNQNLTFQPSSNMATPQNYVLGPGDQVIINLWGDSQKTIDETISPDGTITVELAGVIRLGGLTVSQAKQTIKTKLGQYYSGCQFDIAVGDIRTIQVQVAGEVNTPGTYSLSSLSSAFNALYAAGGINQLGTLRDIRVYRRGRQIAAVDVYDYLVNGNSSGDVHLQDNDVIVVGPYDCLVEVQGKVKRPMWYEMKSTETLKQLMRYCGGFTGDAYTDKVRLTRKAGSNYSVHTVGEFDMASFGVKDEDLVEVDSVRPRFANTVEVRGAVKHAGKFQLGGSIQTVRELLLAADGLTEDAYQERAVMHREKEDLTLEMVGVDVKGILNGTVADIPLKSNDMLFVPSSTEMHGKRTYTISGEVIYPGIYPFAENATVRDLILQAGGFTDAASLARVDVFRRVRDARAAVDTKSSAQCFTFSLNEDYSLVEDTVFMLKPYDEVLIRKSPAYEKQQNVSINGCVNFVGRYTMTSKDYRLSDLVKAAGGFTQLAYVEGARLERRMTEEEKMQRDNAFNKAQIDLYEQAMKEGKDMNRELADTLLQMKMNQDDTYPVALDLKMAVENPGCLQDIVLREGDVITVPQYSNTIKISGEVGYPISMNFVKGKKLSYYITHAGGYGNKAKKNTVYAVYANGGVKRIRKHSSKDIQPGCEIVVPTKTEKQGMTTQEIMALSSGGASLASVVVALISILKK
ncbi:MAG: SLBB domain-containing protein [Bacteroidales bacterium]|nr:SLBB domain-containing protein [Candidatus Physcousia equi]